MSIKAVFIALLALCLMIGCVAGADCCGYDHDNPLEPINPVAPFKPIDPHSKDVGSQIAEYYKELFENLFGGGGRPPFLTE